MTGDDVKVTCGGVILNGVDVALTGGEVAMNDSDVVFIGGEVALTWFIKTQDFMLLSK